MEKLKGFRTVLFNGLVIAGIALLNFVAGADMSALDPTAAVVLVAAANLGLRFLTKTKVGG